LVPTWATKFAKVALDQLIVGGGLQWLGDSACSHTAALACWARVFSLYWFGAPLSPSTTNNCLFCVTCEVRRPRTPTWGVWCVFYMESLPDACTQLTFLKRCCFGASAHGCLLCAALGWGLFGHHKMQFRICRSDEDVGHPQLQGRAAPPVLHPHTGHLPRSLPTEHAGGGARSVTWLARSLRDNGVKYENYEHSNCAVKVVNLQ
jgi:hypothetical protein